MKIRLVLLGLGLCSALAASPAAAAGKPVIRITTLHNGETIHGSTGTGRVAVSNFKLVPPVYVNPPKLTGQQGHIHYVLDALANFVATRDAAIRLSHTWTNVAPGRHTIIAYLATSQHAPFPGVRSATARITVVPAVRPSIRITGLQDRRVGRSVDLEVHVTVSHFTLVKPVFVNPPALSGDRGHIHYVLDSLKNFAATRDAATALMHPWTHVAPGRHTIIAYLATSQHQLFPGTQPAVAHITIPAASGATSLRVVASLPRTGGATAGSQGSGLLALLLGCAALALGAITWRRR